MGALRDKWIIRWKLVNSISTLAAEEMNLTDRVRAGRKRAKAAFLHVLLCELLLALQYPVGKHTRPQMFPAILNPSVSITPSALVSPFLSLQLHCQLKTKQGPELVRPSLVWRKFPTD